jgi:hypothetical protein
MQYGDFWSEAYQAYQDRLRTQPSHRTQAMCAYGDDQSRIQWDDQRPFLLKLDRHQLRPAEGAVLDWMLDPAGRTLSQVAADVGISKGYASKLRYRLLIKSRAK